MTSFFILRTTTAFSLHPTNSINPFFARTIHRSTSTSTLTWINSYRRQISNLAFANQQSNSESHNNYKNSIQIGRRSTCRRPPYKIHYAKPPSTDDETTSSTRTAYTIDDSICPPTDPEKLEKIIQKHCQTLPIYLSKKPIAKHTLEAFDIADQFVQNFFADRKLDRDCGVIIDSGCGTARSTILLAKKYPQHIIIGIDRSLVRLSRNAVYRRQDLNQEEYNDDRDEEDDDNLIQDKSILSQSISNLPNVLLLRAELADFWKCYIQSNKQWNIVQHYLLYPNPYPKKSRLKSRWYGHPAFPLLMKLIFMDNLYNNETEKTKTIKLTVRSNWEGYLKEFATSMRICQEYYESDENREDGENDCFLEGEQLKNLEIVGPDELTAEKLQIPMTNFEKKFVDWAEPVYELRILG